MRRTVRLVSALSALQTTVVQIAVCITLLGAVGKNLSTMPSLLVVIPLYSIILIIFMTCVEGTGRLQQFRLGVTEMSRALPEGRRRWIETLSWSPRAFLYHNFLTQEETKHIVSIARPLMKRSTVIGLQGQDEENSIRTSYGTFISRLHDPVITDIEERIAIWTHLNASHQEDMQVLRYGVGQEYRSHFDSTAESSPRYATVILYLNDVEHGGETAFPESDEWSTRPVDGQFLSKCAKGSIAVKPKRGDALLFFSLKSDLTMDEASLHRGCPVIKGVKWTATKWIHTAPFRPDVLGQELVLPRFPDQCENYDEQCDEWSDAGECKNNPKFMIGDSYTVGSCRLACGECEVCGNGDDACMSRNREKAGFLPMIDDDAF